jgi:hypothetical protein
VRGRPFVSPDGIARTAALALAASLLAGCAGWTTNPALTLRVDSAIDRPLLVYVNNEWVGTIPAEATSATVPASGHGGPPWTVDGRTSSGSTLITLRVDRTPTAGDGVTTTAALACGQITFTVGSANPGPTPTLPARGASLPPCQ